MKTARLLVLLSGAVAFASAQSVSPTAADPAASSTKTDSIVQLSPFEVTSNTDVGYQATDTLAGSRVNTSLKDVPASISVFTEEFIKDINAADIREVMAYGSNFQPDLDDAGSFGDASSGNSVMGTAVGSNRSRGLPVDFARNYFKWQNPTDTYNVGRVEDSRGPNSVLFGIGSAGGIINVATKQATLKRNTREVSLSGGSFSSWRATLDANQPLGDKAAVRFNAVTNNTRYFQPYRYSESQRAHLAAKYEPASWLTLRAEYEKGEVEANAGRLTGTFDSMSRWHNAGRPLFASTAPATAFAGLGNRLTAANLSTLRYVSNSNQLIHMGGQIATVGIGGIGVGYPIMDTRLISFSVNSGGPGQVRTNPYSNLSAIATARLGQKTFVEIGANRQFSHFVSIDPVFSHQLYADPNRTLPGNLGANPYAGRLYMETYWRRWESDKRVDSLRLSISHEVNAGKWGRYRAGVFGELEKEIGRSWPSFEALEGL
ncbi:MAG: TonB-dependent receptor plug domain-containing protein, partial [Opitutaceae bacterium]|nr:TonB-dependent receptor plug domain-containing protein [Opitutaceae bacterium]